MCIHIHIYVVHAHPLRSRGRHRDTPMHTGTRTCIVYMLIYVNIYSNLYICIHIHIYKFMERGKTPRYYDAHWYDHIYHR